MYDEGHDLFEKDNDSSYQSYSIDISSHISADTAIHLLGSPSLGKNDQIYFEDIQISCWPQMAGR